MKLWMERKDVNKKSEWYRCVKRKKKSLVCCCLSVWSMLQLEKLSEVIRALYQPLIGLIYTDYTVSTEPL